MDVLSTLRRNNPQLGLPEPTNSFDLLMRRAKGRPSDTLDHIILHRLAKQSKLPAGSLGFTCLPALTPTMPAVKLRVVATSTIRADTTNAEHGEDRSNSTSMLGALNQGPSGTGAGKGLHNSLLRMRACRVAAESGPSIQAALATDGTNLKQQARTLLGPGPPLWFRFLVVICC